MPGFAGPDGRVHPNFRVTRTATGRLSSSDPNIMAQPVRDTEGRQIREGFIAAPGHGLLAGDFSQIEMRVAAHAADDKVMCDMFRRGADIHTETACKVFGLQPHEVDDTKHRYPCKRIGFGVLYGIGPAGLREQLQLAGLTDWTEADCERLIKSWFDVYKGIKGYMAGVHAHALRHGFVREPVLGRIRFVPGVWSASKKAREEALRQAGNAPVQMGAQSVIKVAMCQARPLYQAWNRQAGTPVVRPLIQIHDDLTFEIREDYLVPWMVVLKSVMETAVTLRVPVLVDFKQGTSWGKMDKVKLE
jgi:DNA polymerase-1